MAYYITMFLGGITTSLGGDAHYLLNFRVFFTLIINICTGILYYHVSGWRRHSPVHRTSLHSRCLRHRSIALECSVRC